MRTRGRLKNYKERPVPPRDVWRRRIKFCTWMREYVNDHNLNIGAIKAASGVANFHFIATVDPVYMYIPRDTHIIRIARAIGVPSDTLFNVAERVPPDIARTLNAHPEAVTLVREQLAKLGILDTDPDYAPSTSTNIPPRVESVQRGGYKRYAILEPDPIDEWEIRRHARTKA